MLGGPAGGNDIVARFAQQATLEHQMRPLVAVQIIITAPHGNTRGPAGVKAEIRVCVSRPAAHALSRIHGFLVAIACKSTLVRERASKRANAADLSPFGCVIRRTVRGSAGGEGGIKKWREK